MSSGTARIAIAEHTLAACESGRYVNARHEIVEIGALVAAAKLGTELYDLATYPTAPTAIAATTAITVTGETTIAALRRLAGTGHVGCLNFASATTPGGGFLVGAEAQEESLARSSALHYCLLAQPAHYARNKAHGSALYLDLAIYAPHVPFFRDDDGAWLDQPATCSVITCAAPNVRALREHGRFDAAEVEATLRRRAAFVLAIARDHGIERMILGAWGAGVFGNDPMMVARVFRELLTEYAFPEVVFAIYGGPGSANYDAFAATFA